MIAIQDNILNSLYYYEDIKIIKNVNKLQKINRAKNKS